MKVASFMVNGRSTFGVVRAGKMLDCGIGLSRFTTLREVLAAGALPDLSCAADTAPAFDLDEVEFLPVIPDAAKILCIGLNYMSHIEETHKAAPDKPCVFIRFADTQVGSGQALLQPLESTAFDFQGALAVVMGRSGRRIPEAEALAHVAGYACYNEASLRDYQKHTAQFTPGKNFPATGGFGPWMVTADEIANPGSLMLTTRHNGTVMQQESTGHMLFGVPALIAYCSSFTNLSAGDVIVTGTPGGVGAVRRPPVWMRPGDIVDVEIEGIGILRNTVHAERASNFSSDVTAERPFPAMVL